MVVEWEVQWGLDHYNGGYYNYWETCTLTTRRLGVVRYCDRFKMMGSGFYVAESPLESVVLAGPFDTIDAAKAAAMMFI